MDVNTLIQSCFKPVTPTESKEEIDNAQWIKKIIGSCQNHFHLEVAATLMGIYANKYGITKLYNDLCSEYLKVQAMIIVY
jgi:hypothetical protein